MVWHFSGLRGWLELFVPGGCEPSSPPPGRNLFPLSCVNEYGEGSVRVKALKTGNRP